MHPVKILAIIIVGTCVLLGIGIYFESKEKASFYSPDKVDSYRKKALPPNAVVLKKEGGWWTIELQKKKYLCNFTEPQYANRYQNEQLPIVNVMIPVE